MTDFIREHWSAIAVVLTTVVGFTVGVLKVRARIAKNHALADVERAKLTDDPLDDIDAREKLANVEALEDALSNIPAIGNNKEN